MNQTLKIFVVWERDDDDDGRVVGACVVAAQSAEHARTMVDQSGDRKLPWAEHVQEIVDPWGVPGVLWVMEKKS